MPTPTIEIYPTAHGSIECPISIRLKPQASLPNDVEIELLLSILDDLLIEMDQVPAGDRPQIV